MGLKVLGFNSWCQHYIFSHEISVKVYLCNHLAVELLH